MDFILDFWITFSMLGIIVIVLLFALLAAILGIKSGSKGNRKRISTRLENILTLGGVGVFLAFILGYIAVLVYYNPTYWGYGKTSMFHHAVAYSDKLLLHDYLVVNGKNSHSTYTRLQVIEAQTGKRLFRGMVGKFASLKAIQNDTAWYVGKYHLMLLDVRNYRVLAQLDANSLQKIPALQKGLALYNNESIIQLQDKEITVTTVEGYQYLLNPFTLVVKPKPNKPAQTGYTKPITYPKFSLRGAEGNQLRQTIIREGINQPLNPAITFLNPTILHTDSSHNCLIVRHDEVLNANQKQFILSAISFEGKLMWEKRLADFACWDMYSFWGKYDFHRSVIYRDKIILTFGGFVYALDIKTGKLKWENRF